MAPRTIRLSRSFGGSLLLISTLVACAPPEDGEPAEVAHEALGGSRHPCYVAFIHGAGRDLQGDPEGAREYWAPATGNWRNPTPMWEHSLIRWVSQNESTCRTTAIGYRGDVDFMDDLASVGWQLRDFIDQHDIPDHRMIIVAHSMGGLVSRYLLNTAEPNSPGSQDPRYSPGDLENFAVVKAKTGYVITLQTPHFGSEGADALYGEASFPRGNVGGAVLKFLGLESPTGSTASLRRGVLEARASTMGDAGRTIKLWSLAGQATYNDESRQATSGLVDDDDGDLHSASTLLFGVSWQYYFRNDGLVERRSAHGQSILKGGGFDDHHYTSDRSVQGAFERWASTPLNHNHGRFSDIWTRFVDSGTEVESRLHLGDKIRMHGLGLPCSDPGTRHSQSGRCDLQVPSFPRGR